MSIWRELRQRDVVRVAILYLAASWLILQVAALVADIYALPESMMRWLGIILALGLPAVLALSWIFQWTPEGLVRETDGAPDRRRFSGQTVSLAALVFVLLGAGVYFAGGMIDVAGDVEPTHTPDGRPTGSLAIIPFVNNSDSSDTGYFADGLSSELLNLLASVPELQVTGRTSSFRYKDTDVDPRTIGNELNVAHILEGEVRKSGDRLRISVQLIDTSSGFQVWQETFDQTIADVFVMQDEIAARTVDGLRVTLTGALPSALVTSPEAFDLFLSARYHYRLRSAENYVKARDLLLQAIELDDSYAPFWTLLESTYTNLVIVGELDYDEGSALAREAVETALEVDPDNAIANLSRAWYAMYFERDFQTAGRLFARALRSAPGTTSVLADSATYASSIGQLERAEEFVTAAIAREPVAPALRSNYASLLNRLGRHEDSIASAEKALELRPDHYLAIVNICQANLLAGRPEQALECTEQIADRPHGKFTRMLVLHDLGRTEEALAILEEYKAEHPDDGMFQVARVYAWMGESDLAFEWLERLIESDNAVAGIKSEWSFRSLHSDPRWDDAMRRLGLADDQVAEFRL